MGYFVGCILQPNRLSFDSEDVGATKYPDSRLPSQTLIES